LLNKVATLADETKMLNTNSGCNCGKAKVTSPGDGTFNSSGLFLTQVATTQQVDLSNS